MNNRNVADKLRKTDIVLKLKPIDGSPRSVIGITDRSLFTGSNNLHAIMNTETCLWRLAYDNGTLPTGLRGHTFTGFHPLMKHVGEYFKKRNVEISEVID